MTTTNDTSLPNNKPSALLDRTPKPIRPLTKLGIGIGAVGAATAVIGCLLIAVLVQLHHIDTRVNTIYCDSKYGSGVVQSACIDNPSDW